MDDWHKKVDSLAILIGALTGLVSQISEAWGKGKKKKKKAEEEKPPQP